MNILIIGSCTAKKVINSNITLHCKDLSKEKLREFQEDPKYKTILRSAGEMYQGYQNVYISDAISILNQFSTVQYFLISAGFGLINSKTLIPPYECTFNGLSKIEIQIRSNNLKINEDLETLFKKRWTLIILALGEKYQIAIEPFWKHSKPDCPIIVFGKDTYYNPNAKIVRIPANNGISKRLTELGIKSSGPISLKGLLIYYLASSMFDRIKKQPNFFASVHETPKIIRDLLSDENLKKYARSQPRSLTDFVATV